MKKATSPDEVRSEYDLRGLKIVERGPGRRNSDRRVQLDADVATAFPNSEAVNAALRKLMNLDSGQQTLQ